MTSHKIIFAYELRAGDAFAVTRSDGQVSRPIFVDWIHVDPTTNMVEIGILNQGRDRTWFSLPSSKLVTTGLTNRWAKRERSKRRKRSARDWHRNIQLKEPNNV